jgi:para-aminobenzoate synthetase component 1
MSGLDLLRRVARPGEPAAETWAGVAVAPSRSLCVRDGRAWLREGAGAWVEASGDPWTLLRSLQGDDAPFAMSIVVFVGYDAGRWIETLPAIAEDDLHLPDVLAFRFDAAWDAQGALHARPGAEVHARMLRDRAHEGSIPFVGGTVGEMEARTSPKDFEAMVLRAKRHIRVGDAFQVNLSHRLSCATDVAPVEIYARLRAANPAPFSCYLQSGPLPDDPEGFEIVSSSPERLFRVGSGRLEARPVAGTRPRGATPAQDAALRHELLRDEKERAEHVMLVDLARNDLGRVARFGSVRVPALLTVESYRTVHHLVSIVEAELAPGRDAVDALVAMFPGGTITGAPKVRSMEIIEEIEPVRRGAYTGSLGWIADDGDADLNILIRTLVRRRGRVHLQVGAGIVEDSDPAREYEETMAKAKGLLLALGREVPR